VVRISIAMTAYMEEQSTHHNCDGWAARSQKG
jgi:hypothetical protein